MDGIEDSNEFDDGCVGEDTYQVKGMLKWRKQPPPKENRERCFQCNGPRSHCDEFQVAWEGCDPETREPWKPTWEPACMLRNSAHLMTQCREDQKREQEQTKRKALLAKKEAEQARQAHHKQLGVDSAVVFLDTPNPTVGESETFDNAGKKNLDLQSGLSRREIAKYREALSREGVRVCHEVDVSRFPAFDQSNTFCVGDEVEGTFAGMDGYFRGVVTKVTITEKSKSASAQKLSLAKSRTYEVKFDDGDVESGKTAKQLKLVGRMSNANPDDVHYEGFDGQANSSSVQPHLQPPPAKRRKQATKCIKGPDLHEPELLNKGLKGIETSFIDVLQSFKGQSHNGFNRLERLYEISPSLDRETFSKCILELLEQLPQQVAEQVADIKDDMRIAPFCKAMKRRKRVAHQTLTGSNGPDPKACLKVVPKMAEKLCRHIENKNCIGIRRICTKIRHFLLSSDSRQEVLNKGLPGTHKRQPWTVRMAIESAEKILSQNSL